MKTPKVTITTDGGCWPNPGPGAWAAVLRSGSTMKTATGTDAQTTNNRMEMTAIIEALRMLKVRCEVILRTDSMTCVYAIQDAKRKKKRANLDLVHALWTECDKHHITVEWVRGHNGDPDNEHCDKLAAGLIPKQPAFP